MKVREASACCRLPRAILVAKKIAQCANEAHVATATVSAMADAICLAERLMEELIVAILKCNAT